MKENLLSLKNDLFVFDVGSEYGQEILKDSVIVITVDRAFGDNRWIRLNNADTNLYDWSITVNFQSGIFSLPRDAMYSTNTAIDFSIWP